MCDINRYSLLYVVHATQTNKMNMDIHHTDEFTVQSLMMQIFCLTFVMPYDDIDLSQHWVRQWLVAWWDQAITWTNVNLPSMEFFVMHMKAISQEVHKSWIHVT